MMKRCTILCWTGLAVLVSALGLSSAPQAGMQTPPGVEASDCPPFYFAYQRDLQTAQANLNKPEYRSARDLVARQIETYNSLVNIVGSQIKDCVKRGFAKSCGNVAKEALEYADSAGKKQPDYAGARMFFQRACDLSDKGACKKAQDAAKKASQVK